MALGVSNHILGSDKQKMDFKIPTMRVWNAINLEASN